MATERYSCVIVGAGSAGCVLAGRLSADPTCRVLLLEAGGSNRKREIRIPAAFTKLLQTGYDWNYRTSEQPQLSDRRAAGPGPGRVARRGRLGDATHHPRPHPRAYRHDRRARR